MMKAAGCSIETSSPPLLRWWLGFPRHCQYPWSNPLCFVEAQGSCLCVKAGSFPSPSHRQESFRDARNGLKLCRGRFRLDIGTTNVSTSNTVPVPHHFVLGSLGLLGVSIPVLHGDFSLPAMPVSDPAEFSPACAVALFWWISASVLLTQITISAPPCPQFPWGRVGFPKGNSLHGASFILHLWEGERRRRLSSAFTSKPTFG